MIRCDSKYPMPGVVPGTHVLVAISCPVQDVDGRDKPGHGGFDEILRLGVSTRFRSFY